MRDNIISFFQEKGISLCEKSETVLETESGFDYETIKGLWLELISAGFAVAGSDESSELPKLFLLTPLSGDMCKYKLEVDL